MAQQKSTLKERANVAFQDDFLRKAVRFTADRLRGRKADSTGALGDWEEWRERGRAIRSHVIENLDYYLDQFIQNAEKRGIHVHFAKNTEDAIAISLKIAKDKNTKLIAKSKSMVSEEVHLNHYFEEQGIECLETDLGEWIVQLAHETPSHIIIPAIHKNRYQVQELFEKESGETLSSDTKVLAGYARRKLRQRFAEAEIGMTGCNFALAESGSVVLFSNEGNARMVTTLPKTHIVMMGMERIIPSWEDLEVMANLLPRSATGQKITVYMTALSGPRRAGEVDGPEDVHIIILDNGRSAILGDDEFQEVLNCIRCGACLNVCPVYRQVGGHTYGGTYSGPIGAVITPLLMEDKKQWGELAYASSLCGACHEACPVKIPLHDMLVHLRRRYVEAGFTPLSERMAYKGYAAGFKSVGAYKLAGKSARWVQLTVMGDEKEESALAKNTPMHGWTKYRTLPEPNKKAFRDRWADLAAEPPQAPRGPKPKKETE
ncbi:iron-sulfur cluster-binding protein [Capsulimonas corticalis]|uniref:Iron-sulfur cluster-binding protein n=1 Tax=Capsulimonas corticalis TaxID=2219043 RepID=A0A402CV95_9BACT|nr:LutB/LldF family L-lactate oxidation iron-sulfur protein [Capsulimonas corticalis]BDI30322.1 iron-sulfur cluster-binding protein [Capsulimonas corticalis]